MRLGTLLTLRCLSPFGYTRLILAVSQFGTIYDLFDVDEGKFSVELGGPVTPFPSGLFDNPVFLGIEIDADGEMSPRKTLTSAPYALKADDAMTLQGQSAASLDQSAHVFDIANPHNVTAAQAGAPSNADFSNHTGDSSAHHARYTDAEAVSAMGIQADANALNHDKYTNAESVAAILNADGPGSGLNADLLDGQNSTFFNQSAHVASTNNPHQNVFSGLEYDNSPSSTAVTAISLCTSRTTLKQVTISLPVTNTTKYVVCRASGKTFHSQTARWLYYAIDDESGTGADTFAYTGVETTTSTYNNYDPYAMQQVYSYSGATGGFVTYYLKACRQDASTTGSAYHDDFVCELFTRRY